MKERKGKRRKIFVKQGRGEEEEFRETGSGERRERCAKQGSMKKIFVKQGMIEKGEIRETGQGIGGRVS